MRETTRSLGAYFVLVGFFYIVGAFFAIYAAVNGSKPDPLTLGILGFAGLLGIGYMWVGSQLKKLLASSPAVPIRLTIVGLVLGMLRFSIFGVLINIYIIYQLKRLATESVEVTESRTLD